MPDMPVVPVVTEGSVMPAPLLLRCRVAPRRPSPVARPRRPSPVARRPSPGPVAVARPRGCRPAPWLSPGPVPRGCRPWLSPVAVARGCRPWLSPVTILLDFLKTHAIVDMSV